MEDQHLSSGYTYLQPGFVTSPSIGDSLITTGAHHDLHYLSLPITALYLIEGKRISFSAGGGLSVNKLLWASLKTEVEDGTNREEVSFSKLQGMRSIYLGVVANADIAFKLNNKLSMSLLPSLKYAVTPITKNNSVKTFPYSYGLGIRVTWKL